MESPAVGFSRDNRSLAVATVATIRAWSLAALTDGRGETVEGFPAAEVDALRREGRPRSGRRARR